MRKLIGMLIAVIALTSQLYCFSINIDPPSLYTTAKPGESVISKIMVENTSNEPVHVKVYAQDWQYNADMSKKFLELGQTPYSLNKALSLYVQELTIPVKGKKEVLFELKSPTDKQGGLYGVIFFESAPVQSNKSSTVQLIGRIGTIIYHEIGGSQKSSFELVYNKKETAIDKTNFYIDLINQGNVHVDLKGSLLILGANKEILDRVPISALKALPKTKQSFVLTSKRNFENKATSALLTLTYGDNQVYSKVFNLK